MAGRTGRYISMAGVTDLPAASAASIPCTQIHIAARHGSGGGYRREILWKGGAHMINFEEELAKFKPSREVDEVEQILRNQTVSDIADLLAEVMEEKRKN